MKFSFMRMGAVLHKELREYRRSPFIVGTMAVLPLIFLVEPIIIIFRLGASVPAAAVDKSVGATFLLLLITPVFIPAVLAAYSVVGEREQGTLEPLLTTPVRREELLLGKALGVVAPAVAIAYLVFAIVELSAHLFASNAEVVAALSQGPHVLAEILFAPLLAGWSIWVGIAISTRAREVRVAQQLGTLASLPLSRWWLWCHSMSSRRASPFRWPLPSACSWQISSCGASCRRCSIASDSSWARPPCEPQAAAVRHRPRVRFDGYRAPEVAIMRDGTIKRELRHACS